MGYLSSFPQMPNRVMHRSMRNRPEVEEDETFRRQLSEETDFATPGKFLMVIVEAEGNNGEKRCEREKRGFVEYS